MRRAVFPHWTHGDAATRVLIGVQRHSPCLARLHTGGSGCHVRAALTERGVKPAAARRASNAISDVVNAYLERRLRHIVNAQRRATQAGAA